MSLLLSFLDLLFPPRCVFCRGRLGEDIQIPCVCATCLTELPLPDECCSRCGQPLPSGAGGCRECRGQSFSFAGACAVREYTGPIRTLVHKYKYKGHRELAGVLGALMARQVRLSSWPQPDAVVPIPLHHDRLMERGYDQAALLSQVVADELRLPVKNILVRNIATPSQTKLSAKERWENVTNAFELVKGEKPPRRVLLIDDLLTTGATAHFAGHALINGGACEVYLAVVGR